jgi:diacylglycerol kinase family enzyme
LITVIVNHASGTKRDEQARARLVDLFQAGDMPGKSVEIVDCGTAAGVTAAAASAAATGADAVVAAGGDGTVNAVASALAGSDTPLGVVPLGTFNHFAKDLGIPVGAEAAVTTIAAGRTKSVDVGAVNDRIFVNNSSLGVYPDIVSERESLRQQGYRKWTAFAIAGTRVLRNYRGLIVTITAGGATIAVPTPFLFVGNNRYEVEGLRLGKRASLEEGRLYAYLAPRVHGRELPKLVVLALTGRASERHTLEAFATCELQVGTPPHRVLRVALDGEVVLMHTPLLYRVRPRALNVIVP